MATSGQSSIYASTFLCLWLFKSLGSVDRFDCSDGVRWADYGQELQASLVDLHARVHSGAYRARPSLRAYIPKAGGGSNF